jgi:molybdopterin-guanine dinucleotide biosynthesis protein B
MGKFRPTLETAKERGKPPLFCIVGFSGSGKTTLMIGLITALKKRGLRVGTIKHDAHSFDMDRPGKDSYRHKAAGASASLITSPTKIAMVADVDRDHHPEELLPLLPHMDIVLAEGFKRAKLPKIEVYRPETGKGAACKGDPNLIALVSDAALDWGIPRFSTAQIDALVHFLLTHGGLESTRG